MTPSQSLSAPSQVSATGGPGEQESIPEVHCPVRAQPPTPHEVAVPLETGVWLHWAAASPHESLVHALWSSQLRGDPPRQRPREHCVSTVQNRWSSHTAPLAIKPCEQM